MANLALIFRRTHTLVGRADQQLGLIEVDAAVVQEHVKANEVTDHPVERGANISDHKRDKPDYVTIEGIISNTPINLMQRRRVVDALGTRTITTATEPAYDGAEGRAEAAKRKLDELKRNGDLIQVITRLESYSNMVIEQIRYPVDSKTGDAIRFHATFKRIEIVDSKVTPVVVAAEPKANRKNRLGKQAPQVTSEATELKSKKSAFKRVTEGNVASGANRLVDRLKVGTFAGGESAQ